MEQTKYDVFISYSRKDYVDENGNVILGNEVSKIIEALDKAKITYWFDVNGIYIGDEFPEKIIEGIENSRLFLFISSKNACESPWTSKEIACADEFGKFILPVRIDKTPYNKKIMFRIADRSFIDYGKNPEKGRQDVVSSIKVHLREIKEKEEESLADERRRQEELKRQRRIAELERELSSLEAQRTERQKFALQKEQDYKLAQIDLEECDNKIQKLKEELESLRNPEAKRQEEKRKAAEEQKRREEEERAKELTFTVGGVPFKMIRVEGGSTGTFYIGETQVTQELWQAVMGSNPSGFEGQDHPVECVSWNDICGVDGKGTDPDCFLHKLKQKTGMEFRLPNESEWEYAARGGNKSKNYEYAGSDNIDQVAWYWKNSGDKDLEGVVSDWDYGMISINNCKTHPVKKLAPNELGIYDMSGNVWEWCQDLYDQKGSDRVLRGGSWFNDAGICREASHRSPAYRSDDGGFRLALVHQ